MNSILATLEEQYHKVRVSNLPLYKETELYYKKNEGEYVLYKGAGKQLSEEHLTAGHHPQLFVRSEERVDALKELQVGFSAHLKAVINGDDPEEIKNTLVTLVDETFKEPRSGVLGVFPEITETVVGSFSKNYDVMHQLAFLSDKDYTTAMHVVNVMALTIGFCHYANLTIEETNDYALMALLHDMGKTAVPDTILKSDARLTPQEFQIMKSHPEIGEVIIRNDPDIDNRFMIGASEHHEKLDGSGYPRGITDISFPGQLIGLIDCYEALTGDERPYRRATAPLATLEMLKGDVEAGKLSQEIFMVFAKSLV